MSRTITISFDDDPNDPTQYADAANTAWQIFHKLPNARIEYDEGSSADELNKRWDDYGHGTSWT